MATFGATEFQGLMALVIMGLALAFAAKAALSNRGVSKDLRRLRGKLDDFEEREELGRLRHRDFDAFLKRLNERRARLDQPALTREYLLPHQYNLMYSVDAGDVDEAALEALRKRVSKAVDAGQEPPAEPAAR